MAPNNLTEDRWSMGLESNLGFSDVADPGVDRRIELKRITVSGTKRSDREAAHSPPSDPEATLSCSGA